MRMRSAVFLGRALLRTVTRRAARRNCGSGVVSARDESASNSESSSLSRAETTSTRVGKSTSVNLASSRGINSCFENRRTGHYKRNLHFSEQENEGNENF